MSQRNLAIDTSGNNFQIQNIDDKYVNASVYQIYF